MQYQDRLSLYALRTYAKSLNRRAADLNAAGDLSAVSLRSLILASGGVCAWCGVSLVNAEFEIEHIMPLARGGTHEDSNLAVSCPDCNRRKGDMHPAKFAQVCLNRTGTKTMLILKILQDYEMTPTQQLSLFDTPSPENAILDTDDNDLEPPAPYIWGRTGNS